jgi:rhodanese-related sulfurtransferase
MAVHRACESVALPAMAISEIGVDDLAERLDTGARLVDVRERDEWEQGHIDGAVHVPLATVPQRLDVFRGEGPTYVICTVGGRSLRACDHVAGYGIEVVNVAGGMLAWERSGRAIVTGPT